MSVWRHFERVVRESQHPGARRYPERDESVGVRGGQPATADQVDEQHEQGPAGRDGGAHVDDEPRAPPLACEAQNGAGDKASERVGDDKRPYRLLRQVHDVSGVDHVEGGGQRCHADEQAGRDQAAIVAVARQRTKPAVPAPPRFDKRLLWRRLANRERGDRGDGNAQACTREQKRVVLREWPLVENQADEGADADASEAANHLGQSEHTHATIGRYDTGHDIEPDERHKAVRHGEQEHPEEE